MNFSTPENRVEICELYNIQEHQFIKDINYLRKWLSEQPHLPKIDFNDNFIGNFILRRKFSIEGAKKSLDMFFTIRRTFSECFSYKDPRIICKQEGYDDNIVATCRRSTNGSKLVMYIGILKPHTYNPCLLFQKIANSMEFRGQEDACLEEILVLDIKNYTLEDLLRLNLNFLVKFVKACQSTYNIRTKAVYVINNKFHLTSVLKVLKTLIKQKILERIHFDEGFNCLNEGLAKDVIPKDYGGDGPSLEELSKSADLEILQAAQFFDTISNIEINEELRPTELLSNVDDVFGMYGNFKKLNVD